MGNGDNNGGKRKQPPAGGASGPNLKKRQGGSAGRWQTPHHRQKLETLKGRTIEIGDAGVWATCMRGKERQAAEELIGICNEVRASLGVSLPPSLPSKNARVLREAKVSTNMENSTGRSSTASSRQSRSRRRRTAMTVGTSRIPSPKSWRA